MKVVKWTLKKSEARRFLQGHPWIYSNELAQSPKGTPSGSPIEIIDSSGQFIAYGYGNPHTLIAFRELSRKPADTHFGSSDFIIQRLVQAARLRKQIGRSPFSHRLCFSEGDYLPGLIVDRYALEGNRQVFSVQILTSGMQEMISEPLEIFEKFSEHCKRLGLNEVEWKDTGVILKNDSRSREMEGLKAEAPVVLKEIAGVDLTNVAILLPSGVDSSQSISFYTDLVHGQKTGFFLDQFNNTKSFIELLNLSVCENRPLKILDLFSYVGQWGTQIANSLTQREIPWEVTFVDASEQALRFAEKNLSPHLSSLGSVETLKADILERISAFPENSFDIVICDPPGMIKSRKDIAVGKKAYQKLNTHALRIVKKGGYLISSSCSQLLAESDLAEALSAASGKNESQIQWVVRGSQASDHPVRAEFPQGKYLKAWIGIKS